MLLSLPMQTADLSGAYLLLGLYLFLAIGVSFLCSLLEAGLLSLPPSHVAVLAESNSRTGNLLSEMKRNIDRPLAAILTLNTVAHTVGAAGVGAEVLAIWGEAWVAAGSAIVTLLILVLSEIIPKTLGAVHARRLVWFTARAVQIIIWITWPLVVTLELLSHKLGGGKAEQVTREEVRITAQLGVEAGALDHGESKIITNMLRLHDILVKDIMTPRSVVFMLQKDQTVGDVMEHHRALRFSRIPVYDESPDHIVGVLLRSDLYQQAQDDNGARPIQSMIKDVRIVPEVASTAAALDQFIKQKEHLFLVTDEFGGTAGIVTLEDVIETLLGVEIVDETDAAVDMRSLARLRMERRRKERS